MTLRVMASRHSPFYSPLLCCIRFLRDEGHDVPYSVLGPGQRSYALIRDGQVDIMQSAVSSNWNARERGVEPLPVHFAQINTRDGFFLVGREPANNFNWKDLEGRSILADHGLQPLVMLKYAVRQNGADWKKIKAIDAGSPEKMQAAFAGGRGDYIHLQAPIASGEIVASVGESMPSVAFSSLCCARAFLKTDAYLSFLKSYAKAREWVRSAAAEEVAAAEASFFPDIAPELLAAAVTRYQALGTWDGGVEIPRDLYEQALNVFHAAGAIAWRHSFDEVVG
jgi:NitT/TauT family transport system substrate-binding protein